MILMQIVRFPAISKASVYRKYFIPSFFFIFFLFSAGSSSSSSFPASPFGLMIVDNSATNETVIASMIGTHEIKFVRPAAINLQNWNGDQPDAGLFRNAGFKLILTIKSGKTGASDAFKKELCELLDKYRPLVLCVENEEDSLESFPGTPDEYSIVLKAACEIAHSRGIKCINGGLSSSFISELVWDHYQGTEDLRAAKDFALRAFNPEQQKMLATGSSREKLVRILDRGRKLLKIYRDSGIDFINFHWYISDPKSLEETVGFLIRETGLQPVCNEMGPGRDGTVNIPLLAKALKLGLPIVILRFGDWPEFLSSGYLNFLQNNK
ncbi:MAG: hypothetical protein PHW04_12425 [Candidatus Wallbacteria bacterium]|nr:hypothetical protein [Candidatus Wallbacteria bacterium]